MPTAEIIYTDGTQAVKLPDEFQFEGDIVSIRREGEAVILEPVKSATWLHGFFDRIRIDDPAFPRPEQGLDPYVKNPAPAESPGPFAEGDRVRVPWYLTPIEGIIIEDRGPRGDGRRYYRVRIQVDDVSDLVESAWPAEELTLVAKAKTRSRKGRKGKMN